MIVIIATQGRVTTGGHDFEHTARETQNGNVKGTATQIEHGVNAFAGIVQAVGNGRRSRLVDQTQHVDAGHLGRIFGGLPLRIIEVRRHRDHRAVKVIIERVFCAVAQRGQDLGTHFNGRLLTLHCLNRQHALCSGTIGLHKFVRQLFWMGNVGQTAAHEALHRSQGVLWILRGVGHGFLANLTALTWQVTNHRGQDHLTFVIGQALRHAVAHRGHQRMRGAQVNADGNASLVRIRCLTGF